MRILDDSFAERIADAVTEVLESDGGYTPEEIIPGLVQAVVDVAKKARDPEGCLDEAANMLADCGVPDEEEVGVEEG